MAEAQQNPQTQGQSLAPQSKAAEARKPAIRTLKSDVEEFFKTTKPSLAQIVSQEVTQAQYRYQKKEKEEGLKKYYILGVVAALVLFLAGGGALFWFSLKARPSQTTTKISAPSPFFATETSRTISVKAGDRLQFRRLLEDSVHERERVGTVKRIVGKIQDKTEERFISFSDFFDFWKIIPPSNLVSLVDSPIMVFIYYGSDGSRIGFAVRVRDGERAFKEFLSWESTMLGDFRPLLLNEQIGEIVAFFEDRTFRNIDWRYFKLSQEKDLGIGYTIFPAKNILVFTASKEAMETVINRLYSAR